MLLIVIRVNVQIAGLPSARVIFLGGSFDSHKISSTKSSKTPRLRIYTENLVVANVTIVTSA